MSTNPELSADDAALAVLLAGKREELRVRVAALRAEAARLEKVMEGMDGTLRLLNPDAAASPPAARGRADGGGPRKTPRFAKGECLALMQQALREAAHPLTSTELVRLTGEKVPARERGEQRPPRGALRDDPGRPQHGNRRGRSAGRLAALDVGYQRGRIGVNDWRP